MNINEDYEDNQDLPTDAMEAMQIGMGIIHDKLIDPMMDELSEQDALLINVIGTTFLIIAEQANDYQLLMENLQDKGKEFNSDYTRN